MLTTRILEIRAVRVVGKGPFITEDAAITEDAELPLVD